MNRRTALKNCLVFTAGAALIPSCLQQNNKSSISLKNISLTGGQEKLMAAFSETLIPTTDTPGAKEVGAYEFALMMVDDCYSPEEQEKFMEGMVKFDEEARKKYDKSFADLSPAQRTEWLSVLDGNKKDKQSEAVFFYNSARSLTLQAFTGSQYYLTKVHVYEMAPGRYHGCVPVKTAKA